MLHFQNISAEIQVRKLPYYLNFFKYNLFCEESVHKRDFWVVRVLNALWIQGLFEMCVSNVTFLFSAFIVCLYLS